MHMTGFPGVGKTEFTKILEGAFVRAGIKCKVFILIGSIREPQDFGDPEAGRMGLSAPVEAAVEAAIGMIESLAKRGYSHA